MKLRGDESTGWSMGWKINLWARALMGDRSHTILKKALKHSTSYGTNQYAGGIYYNLYDSHAPFQIDGNFGATSGIAEMLLQSHTDTLQILPALPSAWSAGEVEGLKAVGDFTVSIKWEESKAELISIDNNQGQPLFVNYPGLENATFVVNNRVASAQKINDNVYCVPSKAKDKVDIYFGEVPEDVQTGIIGDITGDGIVNVADVTSVVAMILDESLIDNAADVNGDDVVNVADVTYVVSIILGTESASAPARAAAMSEEATPVVSASFDEDNTMYINVANPGYPFTAAQFDIKFEGGIGIVNDGEYYDVFLGSRTSSRNHSEPECNTQPDGSLRVVILSLKNKVFTGEEGDIATVALDVTGIADGVYQYTIKNIALSDPNSKLQYPADVVEWVSVNGGVIGEATGIDSITADGENANEAIYDLSGRKVANPVKGGIYIKGGKKFIM